MDRLSSAARSRLMSAVRCRNTRPEMRVRKLLTSMRVRYRLQRRDLPGSPDIVLPGARLVFFVHGCFWHRHAGCRKTTTPANNCSFWVEKFEQNKRRDRRAVRNLRKDGWKVITIWE